MSLFKPIRLRGKASIAVCPRCNTKVYYDDLRMDPNTKNWYCEACVDIYDPYRLPARTTEDISLRHPRTDGSVDVGEEIYVLGLNGFDLALGTEDFEALQVTT